MQTLKTNCRNCSWLIDNGCILGKDLLIEGKDTFVSGFCSDKSSINTESKTNRNTNINLICTKSDIISHYAQYDKIIFHPILVAFDQNPKDIEEIYNYLSAGNTNWKIDNVVGQKFDMQFLSDYAIRLINQEWFLTTDDKISYDKLDFICAYLLSNKNIMGFILENGELYNTSAFKELQGNMEMRLVDKVDSFENGKEVLIRL